VIQEVIASEKSKVLRNEITEGTFRINAVRLNTHIYQFFKTKVMSEIDTDTIEEFVEYLTAQNFSTPTIIGYLSNFKKVIRLLMRKKILAQMPLFPRLKMNSIPRGAFTLTEYAAILRASKTLRYKACKGDSPEKRFHMRLSYRNMPFEMNWLIRFMVYTFLRPGDIRQLKNKHIEVILGKYNYLRHTAITFRLIYGGNIDLLTLARNARTSVEMIEKFYASTLSAEMNISLLHSKRRS
jgi:integrase